MERGVDLVRIAVVGEPRADSYGRSVAPERGATAIALERLGPEVELAFVGDAEACRVLCERRSVDLIVLDRVDSALGLAVLKDRSNEGPPVVAVCDPQEDDIPLEFFRLGVSECVRPDPDDEELVAVVALEQIRRYRENRRQGAAENRIRWLEGLNDAIVSAIPAALVVVDRHERIVAANPEFSRAFEVDGDQIRGERLDEVLPAAVIESGELGHLIAGAAAQRSSTSRLARCADGSYGYGRVYDARAQSLDDEGRVLLLLSDVSEREHLTRRMEELQRYNARIIQNMNSALLVVSADGTVVFGNATAERILGVGPSGLLERSIGDWFEGRGEERGLLARTLEEGLRFKGAETVVTLDDGKVVPIGISCAPLSEGPAGAEGAVAIFQDLTEIKQLQRQVLQTEKMASIGHLAAGVAHEINNPMGFIHANLFQMSEYLGDLERIWEKVEKLQQRIPNGDLGELRGAAAELADLSRELDVGYVWSDFAKAIRESQEGSERIRHIVRDLRDFSHQDTEERVGADVNQCLDSTASIVWTMMKHIVVLEKEYGELPAVRCFPMQLKQVFMNLLVNAYQAIEARVGASGELGEIRIRTERRNRGVSISISDTGIGIPPENLARIFDPFFTTKEVGAGTGLGLSTSYNIMQKHGGTLQVESMHGEGSCFEVWLPLDAPADTPTPDSSDE